MIRINNQRELSENLDVPSKIYIAFLSFRKKVYGLQHY